MKLKYLAISIVLPIFTSAQSQIKPLKVKTEFSEEITINQLNETPNENSRSASFIESNENRTQRKKEKSYSFIEIGETYYDLPTNRSTGRKVVLHSDGTISAVWTTTENNDNGWPNRGTGYNYFDGSNWLSNRNDRIENSVRTGWPNIALLSNGKEAILSHDFALGGFILSTNASVGGTTWTSSNHLLDDVSVPNTNLIPAWPRMAAANGYMHVISTYATEDYEREGILTPITYSRSADNGQTWDKERILLPGYDTTLYLSGNSDQYAIDVKDSIVAIVIGGLINPVSLWKSTDNGENFTYYDVDNFPYKAWTTGVQMLDTPMTNDGTLDVLIDDNNQVHVFYGGSYVFDDDPSDESFRFYPSTAQLMHWKEGDAEPKICGTSIDMDGDSELNITSETINSLDANGFVPSGLLSAARILSSSVVTMPSATIDANGNIYVVYSSAIETDIHFLNANYRDILISYSTDGGATWNGPQNVTQARGSEDHFPVVAKTADDFVHLVYQQDATPGTFVLNNANGTHPNEASKIAYMAIPTSAILNNSIGEHTLGEEKITKKAEVFVVSQNQPNPFFGSTDVVVYLQSGAETTLTVTDLMGKLVNQGSLGVLPAGNSRVSIDGNGLQPGLYFYTLSTPEHSITKKMQVK